MADADQIEHRRILWAGPLTVVAAIGAVLVIRVVAAAAFDLATMFQPLGWFFPIVDTLVLVTAAVLVFAAVARWAWKPVRTYRLIAFVALMISLIPDFLMQSRRPDLFTWPRTLTLMAMHVAAWAVTVTMLTRLTRCSKSAA
jgi:uncharacterized protein DUF6069